jgi:hypothetical protein
MKNESNSAFPNRPVVNARSSTPAHERIADLAYRLYLEGGRREGHALEDWLRAEQLLQSEAPADVTDVAQPREPGIRPLDEREFPAARGKRGSASREEIRQQNIPPAARQSLRPVERSHQAR